VDDAAYEMAGPEMSALDMDGGDDDQVAEPDEVELTPNDSQV